MVAALAGVISGSRGSDAGVVPIRQTLLAAMHELPQGMPFLHVRCALASVDATVTPTTTTSNDLTCVFMGTQTGAEVCAAIFASSRHAVHYYHEQPATNAVMHCALAKSAGIHA